MGSLERKLRRKDDKERAKYISDLKSEAKKIADQVVDKAMARATDEATEVALAKVLAVSAEIVYNDWSKLQKKETRLKVYVELLNEKLQQIQNPSKEQLEVERLLDEQCGIKIGRK